MIRINLLDVSQERKRLEFLSLALIAGVVWVVTLTTLFVWHRGVAEEIKNTKALIARESQELEQLKKTVGEVEKVKKEKQLLESKLTLIAGLEKHRYHSLRMLQELSEIIPDEIWIDGLEFDGFLMRMKGLSVDMQSVGHFLKRLREHPRFTNPAVTNVKTVGRAGSSSLLEIVSFDLTAGFAPSTTPATAPSTAPAQPQGGRP